MSRPGRLSRRLLRITGLAVVLGVAGVTLHDSVPDPGQMLGAIRSASIGWLVLAFAAELTSLRHFALQQRRLLAGFGVGMSLPRAIAVTFSRSAISFSLPAGSAVSAGFAFRQFRTVGASRRTAAAVTVLSGLLSGVALLLMYGLVVLVPYGGASGTGVSATLVVGTLVVAFVVFAIDWYVSRQPIDGRAPTDVDVAGHDAGHVAGQESGRVAGEHERPAGLVARAQVALRQSAASLRTLPPRSWMLSLVHATVNWANDFACLAATAAALSLDVSLIRLATVYLTVQIVRQIPLSPGGIGVVEVALLAGLISAGADEGPAAATMLLP